MTATILDGRATAEAVKSDLCTRIEKLGMAPGLGTIVVGDDHAYVAAKYRDCADVGIASIRRELPADATQEHVEAVITELNAMDACHGYIVPMPLPPHLDTARILERIDPDKDANGLHPVNLGRLVLGHDGPLPCTPRGIVHLLREYGIPLDGADVVVIGRGTTVGRPLGMLLSRRTENATITLCHTGTRRLGEHVRRADIVVAAVGVPALIVRGMVKPGATVVDVGITRIDGRYVGDVAPEVAEVAGALVPVPGGIGPMTRAMLLTNVVERAEWLTSR